jgi:hypothetical protein
MEASMAFLRRFSILLVVAATAVMVAANVASADKPIRGCTQNYVLTAVNPSSSAQVATDRNGDGWLCSRLVPSGGGNGSGQPPNIVDNTSNYSG